MPTLDELTAALRAFADARDWRQFHDPKNLAMLVASEAGELLAEYRWVRWGEGARAGDGHRVVHRCAHAADAAVALERHHAVLGRVLDELLRDLFAGQQERHVHVAARRLVADRALVEAARAVDRVVDQLRLLGVVLLDGCQAALA